MKGANKSFRGINEGLEAQHKTIEENVRLIQD